MLHATPAKSQSQTEEKLINNYPLSSNWYRCRLWGASSSGSWFTASRSNLEYLYCALLDPFCCGGEPQISLDVHVSDVPWGVHRCPERNVFHSLEFLQVRFGRVPPRGRGVGQVLLKNRLDERHFVPKCQLCHGVQLCSDRSGFKSGVFYVASPREFLVYLDPKVRRLVAPLDVHVF